MSILVPSTSPDAADPESSGDAGSVDATESVGGGLAIGPISVSPPVVLAPMAGVTTAPYRTLCRRFGNLMSPFDRSPAPGDHGTASGGLYVNQMITARALIEGHRRMLKAAEFAPGETPRSIQLYGTDPYWIGEAVRRLVDEGAVDHIDLNLGCPVPKVTRHGGGAALPWHRVLLRDIVRAMVRAAGSVPITCKFRIGIDDDHLTFVETGRIAEDEGAAAVALHARTAEQAYSGSADWSAIAELKAAVTSIPVLGNGDIWEAADAVAMMSATGCDGVVIGRGCLGRPWLFRELAEAFRGLPSTPPPSLHEVVAVMVEHLDLLIEWLGPERGVREFRKHTGWYLKGFSVGPQVRHGLNQLQGRDQLVTVIDRFDDEPFPPGAGRLVRGHSHGPKPVVLPHGWLDCPTDPTPPGAAADAYTSGG